MSDTIKNKVAESGLVDINLDAFYPRGERAVVDLKDCLYEGLILREKDFRAWVAGHNWQQYGDKFVAVCCTADAIIPTWAYMLVAVHLRPHAKVFVYGSPADLERELFRQALAALDVEKYRGARVMVHGCSHVPVPESAYVEITRLLNPVAQSIMYGEACSTVPIYKKK